VGSFNGSDPLDVRVTHLTKTGARLYMEEPSGGAHTNETIHYIVAESGRHTLEDGTRIEARHQTTNKVHREGEAFNGTPVTFGQKFDQPPVVLHTLNSNNNQDFMSSVVSSVSASGFNVEQESGGAHAFGQFNTRYKAALRHNTTGRYASYNGSELTFEGAAIGTAEHFYISATTDYPNCIGNSQTMAINSVNHPGTFFNQLSLQAQNSQKCILAGDDLNLTLTMNIPFMGDMKFPLGDYNLVSVNGQQFGDVDEKIGWIAIQSGVTGQIGDVLYKTDRFEQGGNKGYDDNLPQTVDFNQLVSAQPQLSRVELALHAHHTNKYISYSSDADGKLYSSTKTLGEREVFSMVGNTAKANCFVTGTEVTLQTSTGKYWTAGSQARIYGTANAPASKETFTLTNHSGSHCLADGDEISLRAANGNYVVTESNGAVKYYRDWVTNAESFPVTAIGGFTDINQRTAFNQAPVMVADGYTGNGTDGYWTRSAGPITASGASFYADEDSVADAEREHASEGFGYWAIEKAMAIQGKKTVPLDIIGNPGLDNYKIVISNIPNNAKLTYLNDNFEAQSLTPNNGSVIITKQNKALLKGLAIDISNVSSHFTLNTRLTDLTPGASRHIDQPIWINVSPRKVAPNGDTTVVFAGIRSRYDVKRIANAFVVTDLHSAKDNTTRLPMVDVDKLAFNDMIISTDSYHEAMSVTSQLSSHTDTTNKIVVITNIPENAQVNNAVPLGNGAYAIPLTEFDANANSSGTTNYTKASISIDYNNPKLEMSADANLAVRIQVQAITEEQADILGGSARVQGYANAKASANAGMRASASLGADGVRAEVRAYAEAGAVATAGGSFGVNGVATASINVGVSATVSNEISAKFEIDGEGFYVGVKAGSEAKLAANGSVKVDIEFLPGSSYVTGGTATLIVFAKVGAEGEVALTKNRFGVQGSGGAKIGAVAEAGGYSSYSLAGATTRVGGRIKVGPAVGAYGSGAAMYDNGKVHLGVSGDIVVLVGIKVDIDFTLDTGEAVDGATLIFEGYMTASDAVAAGFITAGEAIAAGFITVGEAISSGFIDVYQAVDAGFITGVDAVKQGLIDSGTAIETGLVDAGEAVESGIIDTVD
ncbi:MAG: hypothetical protein MJK04_02475, partial [Psychrosphaera sp.]|nr:hypothetical protein [Psychrosphaera sp.]